MVAFVQRRITDRPGWEAGLTARTSVGLLALAVAVSVGIHIGLTPEHLQAMPRLGYSFIAASVVGSAIAVALLSRPDDPRIAAIAGLFCLGEIFAWALFVLVPVPFFPGTPEAVETIAIVSKLVEAVGVGLAVGLVVPRETPRIAGLDVLAPVALMVLAIVGVTALAPSAGGGTSAGSGVLGRSVPGVTPTSITLGSARPLTGPAAPGYSEIAAASQAYFDYVNARGGVFGRGINLIYKDDASDPTTTVEVTRQLVERDRVFAIFEGLGTPAGTKVVSYLNSQRVPDVFVNSGCGCWDSGSAQPLTFGWQPQYTIEGKILGQYVSQHFPGQRVGVLYQGDEFGRGGLAGLEDEIPGSDIVSKQAYRPGVTTLAPQITALEAAGARVLVDFTTPTYTALGRLASLKLGYEPQLVVSNAGIDPTTVGALLNTLSKGKASGTALIEGAITDGYLPSPTAMTNPWIRLFRKIHAEYEPGAPFDANVVYGMANAYTLVQALESAGRNLTRRKLVDAIDKHGSNWKGPGLVPFRYSKTDHGGLAGVQMGRIRDGKIELFGNALTTDPSPRSPVRPYPTLTPPPPFSGMPTGTRVTDG